MLILMATIFVVILILCCVAGYFVFDDLETVIWPAIVVSALASGGVTLSLSTADRVTIVTSVAILAVAIVLTAWLISRSRSKSSPTRVEGASPSDQGNP